MSILNLELSNKYVSKLILSNKPFLITRVGIGGETYGSAFYKAYQQVNTQYLYSLSNNAGIYLTNNEEAIRFFNEYIEAIEKSTALAVWSNLLVNEQSFLKPPNIPSVHTQVLEPFYMCSENMIPWSYQLLGKKVLIISPFVDSIKKQNDNNFQIFSDGRKLFRDGQEFVYYKAFNTSAGNHLHKSWIETFDIMRNEVSKLDFDIALLSCGGYGLPLSNFIHKKMNKSAIYVGGGLQMVFGVMGKRWETTDYWKDIIKTHNPRFIRPSGDEILNNCNKVENACYW
jgi:hypothetical protein